MAVKARSQARTAGQTRLMTQLPPLRSRGPGRSPLLHPRRLPAWTLVGDGAARQRGWKSAGPQVSPLSALDGVRTCFSKTLFLKNPGGKEMPARGRQRGRQREPCFTTSASLRLGFQVHPAAPGEAGSPSPRSRKAAPPCNSVPTSSNATNSLER